MIRSCDGRDDAHDLGDVGAVAPVGGGRAVDPGGVVAASPVQARSVPARSVVETIELPCQRPASPEMNESPSVTSDVSELVGVRWAAGAAPGSASATAQVATAVVRALRIIGLTSLGTPGRGAPYPALQAVMQRNSIAVARLERADPRERTPPPMIPRHRPALAGTIAVAAALIAPAAAQAARPLVTTGSATKVAFSSAHLTGSVGARGKSTVFFFQYGRTIAYGTQTAEAPAGRATGRTRVGADVLGLEPTRLYHYRLVARNRDGTTLGRDRTFRAKKQPLGFLVTATPNPVPFGDDFAVTGALGGTGAGGRAVALQGRGFPYTGPWTPLGNAQVTAPNGAFSFSVLNAGGNTQYRVVTTGSPAVESAVVPVGVAVRVATHVSRRRVRRSGRVRFSGTITPAKVGALFAVQRLDRKGQWITVAGGVSRTGDASSSRFSKRYKVRRTNRYRIFVSVADGTNQSAAGRTVRVRARR